MMSPTVCDKDKQQKLHKQKYLHFTARAFIYTTRCCKGRVIEMISEVSAKRGSG